MEDLEQTTEKMARQALFQTRAPFRKGSHDEPRMIKKEEVRSPKEARYLLKFELAIDETDELRVQTPLTNLNPNDEEHPIVIDQDLNENVFTNPDEETQEPKNPSQIRIDRSLVDMAFAEGTDPLEDTHILIMPPQSPTGMFKEIPDFDDFSEESRP